jgi:hypothetical protein
LETPDKLNSYMRKLLFTFAWVLVTTCTLFSQDKQSSDTLNTHKVMLIPYDPRYYLSDADRDLAEQSQMDVFKIRNNFRQNIDRQIQRQITGSYQCISLLNDTADVLEETMYRVLGRTGYKYEKAIPITPKQQDDEPIIKLKVPGAPDHKDSKTAINYIPVKADAMYMNAVVKNPQELFKELYEQYQADIFVFLTQFEIKTNYNSCLDIANKIYKREIMVHFSIYDKSGKLMAGSYATAALPSNENHPNKIMGDSFPELARYIAGCLP